MEENDLEQYLVEASKYGYGKTRKQIKLIVEKVAAEKGTLHFEHDSWWKRFLMRHPKLSLCAGDYSSCAHECCHKREHRALLLKAYSSYGGKQSPPQVVSAKNFKVRYCCSGKKGQITIFGCASATGQVLPPFYSI